MEPIDRTELFSRLRRDFARYQFNVDAEITLQSRKTWGRVTDISRGGMFIEVSKAPHVGQRFGVRLALNVPLDLDCVVRRVVEDRGVGVTISVGERARDRFEALLRALSAGDDPAVTNPNLPQPKRPRAMAAAAR